MTEKEDLDRALDEMLSRPAPLEEPTINQNFDISGSSRLENSRADAKQHGGAHYKTKAIQPWNYIASNKLGYFEGNIIKYVSRWRDKGGIEDLRKARHYLDKLIEVEMELK